MSGYSYLVELWSVCLATGAAPGVTRSANDLLVSKDMMTSFMTAPLELCRKDSEKLEAFLYDP